MEVEALSYNEYMKRYGGEYADFAIYSLAYMLQQKRSTLDPRTISEWEQKLIGTRYEIVQDMP